MVCYRRVTQKGVIQAMKWIEGILVLALTVSIVSPVFADAKHDPRKGSVEGDLVDSKCYLMMNAKGGGHQQCAVDCLKGGAPAGIVDKDGNTTILIVSSPAPLASYANKKVKATGKIYGTGKGSVMFVEKLEVGGKVVELPKGMM